MNFNAALALHFYFFMAASNRSIKGKFRQALLGNALAILAFIIGFLTILEYGFDLDFGIDQAFVHDVLNPDTKILPGRMSPLTSLLLVLVNSSLLTLDLSRKRERPYFPSIFFGSVFFFSLLSLTGHIFGAKIFTKFGPYVSIAWQTAGCFFLLSIGLLFARPTRGISGIVLSPSSGGHKARVMLPVTLTLPVLLGWFRLQVEYAGYLNLETGVAALTVSLITLFSIIICFNAKQLTRLDNERTRDADLAHAHLKSFQTIFEQIFFHQNCIRRDSTILLL